MRNAIACNDLWSVLHGILCVHKPRDVSLTTLKRHVLTTICAEANECFADSRLPQIQLPIVETHPVSLAPLVVGLRKQTDYSAHPLVVGEKFRKEDLRLEELYYQQPASSGVCIFGLNDGCDQLDELRDRSWIREYLIRGRLGIGTVDNKIRGKINREYEYEHITFNKMSSFLARLQAQYKRLSFELANVDLQSQEAFELARKGLPRPKVTNTPVVFFLNLSHFCKPNFVINLHCVGETEEFLQDLVNEIALNLDSVASCRQILRKRIGPFDEAHSLLDKHFSLKNFLANMRLCRQLINRDTTNRSDAILMQSTKLPLNELIEDKLVEMLEEKPAGEVIDDCLRIPWGREYET